MISQKICDLITYNDGKSKKLNDKISYDKYKRILLEKIKQSIIDLNKEKEEFNKNKNDLNSTQIEIKKAVEDSKNKFNDIMNSQMK